MAQINRVKFFILVCLGFGTGIIFLAHWIRYDQEVHRLIERGFQQLFVQRFEGEFVGTLDTISFLQPALLFKNVTVDSLKKDDWQWSAQRFKLSFSWLDLLTSGKLALRVLVYNVSSHSKVCDNKLLIFDHLKRFIFNQSPIPIGLKELQIKKGGVKIIAPDALWNMNFHAQAALLPEFFKLNVHINEGIFEYEKYRVCQQVHGMVFLTLKNIQNPLLDVTMQAEGVFPCLEQNAQQCLIRAFWKNNKGQIIINNKDKSSVVALYDIHSNDIDNKTIASYQVRLPLHVLARLACTGLPLPIKGDLVSSGNCWVSPIGLGIDGTCFINNGGFKDICVEQLKSHFFCDPSRLYAHLMLKHHDVDLHALIKSADVVHKKGTLTFMNQAPLALPFFADWIIQTEGLSIDASYDQRTLRGTYTCTLYHTKLNECRVVSGSFAYANQEIHWQGTCGDDSFCVAMRLKDVWCLEDFEYVSKGACLAWLTSDSNNKVTKKIRVDYELLARFLSMYGMRVPGKGFMDLALEQAGMLLRAKINMTNGHILVPGFMNTIRGMHCVLTVDPLAKLLMSDDLMIKFDKGLITSKHAKIVFNESLGIEHIVFPCVAKNVFCSVAKSLLASVNGMLTFWHDRQKGSSLNGFIIVDHAQLKKNIFSAQVQHDLVKPMYSTFDCGLDISVKTKDTLIVKAPLLETNAHIALFLGGSTRNPQISGAIDLMGGSLMFPYRPLHISSGKIYFLPHQLNDPMIELTAKGKIRKYHIVMHCHGSVRAPHITFESTPSLTDEQIVTLLLSGSEDGVLSMAMPSLALNQLQAIVFGNQDDSSKVEKYFKNIFGPLRHIKFVPRFTDQTARGGFRGVIEIDVADQLRALIQKNFSLTEDTKLEIEYYLSDDVTIRGIRDERGDLGGEIEMRMKF